MGTPQNNLFARAAAWWRQHRQAAKNAAEIQSLGASETRAIAHDLGLTETQLGKLAAEGPKRSRLLKTMLDALKLDAKSFPVALQRDLELVCAVCADTRRCKYELVKGTAAKHFAEFCPNAATFEALTEPATKSETPAKAS